MNSAGSLYSDHNYSQMNAQQAVANANKPSVTAAGPNALVAKGATTVSSSSRVPKNSVQEQPGASCANSLVVKDFQERKRSLTLDLTDPKSIRKTLDAQEVLQLLGLSSPDFERLLSQNVACVSQTPTPTQFFYPKNVTAEQEQYARGFIDALNQIHQMRGFVPMSNLLSPGFVSNTLAQADKEDNAKRSEYLLGAFQEQLLARTAASSSLSTVAGNTSSADTAAPLASKSSGGNTTTSTTNESAAGSTTSTVIVCGNHSSNVKVEPAESFCAPSQLSAAAGPSSKAHCHKGSSCLPSSKATAGTQLSTSRPVVKLPPAATAAPLETDSAEQPCKSTTTTTSVPCSDNAAPSSSSSSSSSCSKSVLVKSEVMEYPIGFDFEDSYMNAEGGGEFFNLTPGSDGAAGSSSVSSSNGSSSAAVVNVMLPGDGNRNGNGCGGRSASTAIGQSPSPVGCFLADRTASTSSRSAGSLDTASGMLGMGMGDGPSLCSRSLFASGISPIDPDVQERIKLERKRARNRIAATKCRRRKIEKINELEGRVREVTDHNQSLAHRLASLRMEVSRLRHTVQKHRINGCHFGNDNLATSRSVDTGKAKPLPLADAS